MSRSSIRAFYCVTSSNPLQSRSRNSTHKVWQQRTPIEFRHCNQAYVLLLSHIGASLTQQSTNSAKWSKNPNELGNSAQPGPFTFSAALSSIFSTNVLAGQCTDLYRGCTLFISAISTTLRTCHVTAPAIESKVHSPYQSNNLTKTKGRQERPLLVNTTTITSPLTHPPRWCPCG
jgi:hypothetical protein